MSSLNKNEDVMSSVEKEERVMTTTAGVPSSEQDPAALADVDEEAREHDDDDDSESMDTTTTEEEDHSSPNDIDSLMEQGAVLKEEGNKHFQNKDLEKAARSYRRGTNILKKSWSKNKGNTELKMLLVALQNNLSMVQFKLRKYHYSRDVASYTLEQLDPTNVKAFYRRALAHRQLGNHEEAKRDLREALQQDPANVACKKELAALRQEMEKQKQQQQSALAKAFSSSSSLYDDKEKERRQKIAHQQEQKKREQERYKREKQEWEDECVKRMAQNQPAISFEEWKKEQEIKDKKLKEELAKKKETKPKPRPTKVESDTEDDDDELTEQELAMMRGYKKTKDGRTTSYFTREIPEEEKAKLANNIAPKKLDHSLATEFSSSAPKRLDTPASSLGASRPSAWNSAGTWEEKDCTDWCKKRLRSRLSNVKSTSTCDVAVTAVDELTGEAAVAIAGGRKRYIFDFHVKLKYEVRQTDGSKVIATGVMRIPDICSTSHDELEVAYEAWNNRPDPSNENAAVESRTLLTEQVRKEVQLWVEEFNSQF